MLSLALCLLAYAAPAIVHADKVIPKNQELALADETKTVVAQACDSLYPQSKRLEPC